MFLVGREIHDAAELSFFKEVLMERPCLSLENCEKEPGGHSSEEEHLDSINDTTASYPQLIALRALVHRADELLEAKQEASPLYAGILETLREARNSPNPRVVIEAERALQEVTRE